MTLLTQAADFRRAFRQESPGDISLVHKSLWDMQLRLIDEEAAELKEAAAHCMAGPTNFNREHVLKELSDLVFVSYQFAAGFGFDLDTAMDRVFHSNMSKLGDDGQPIYRADGKVLKGPNYAPPTLAGLFPRADEQA